MDSISSISEKSYYLNNVNSAAIKHVVDDSALACNTSTAANF